MCTYVARDARWVQLRYNLPGPVASTAHRRRANTVLTPVDLCTHPGGEKNYLSPPAPTSQSVSLLLTMHTRQLGDCFVKGPGSHDLLDSTSCFAEGPGSHDLFNSTSCFAEGPGSHDLLDSASCFAKGPGSHDLVSCFEGDSPSFLSATEMRSSSPNLASWSRNKVVLAGSWLQY